MFTNKKQESAAAPRREAGITPPSESRITRAQAPKPEKKSAPSILSTDLFLNGNLKSDSDVKIDGRIDGDVNAKLIQVGEKAIIKGQIVANEVIVDGRVRGQIRGNRVRLNGSAHVEGEIIHETIAIEAGALFEGTVKRQDNPLAEGGAAAAQKNPAAAAQKRPEQGGNS
ncbi:MAG: polymer-forming cytoskeletal protein [Rhodobacteraceae bacterium]|nr:polymer-forming cytoskeletal protein [Paracoccaceae bacterium]